MALPGWIYTAVCAHVIIAIIFISSILYYHYKANTIAVKVATHLDKYLKDFGFDAAPFLAEWYNDLPTVVKINYPPKTVCVALLSNADLFDKTLPPYLIEHDPELKCGKACIDACSSHHIKQALKELFPEEDVDIIYDYDMQVNSPLPKISMVMAGHAAGMAYCNRPDEVENPPWDASQKMMGCSISPKYGGWFGYRAVVVFKNIQDENIEYLPPHDAIQSQELKAKLLQLFNNNWQSSEWRNIIFTDKKYSKLQEDYFNKAPGDRKVLIQELIMKYKADHGLNKGEVKKEL